MPSCRGSSWQGSNPSLLHCRQIRHCLSHQGKQQGNETQSTAIKGNPSERELGCKKQPAAAAKSLQSCPTLCDPIDGSPPGSPIPGILQPRVLEWGAIAFSKTHSETFPNGEKEKRTLFFPSRKLVAVIYGSYFTCEHSTCFYSSYGCYCLFSFVPETRIPVYNSVAGSI